MDKKLKCTLVVGIHTVAAIGGLPSTQLSASRKGAISMSFQNTYRNINYPYTRTTTRQFSYMAMLLLASLITSRLILGPFLPSPVFIWLKLRIRHLLKRFLVGYYEYDALSQKDLSGKTQELGEVCIRVHVLY